MYCYAICSFLVKVLVVLSVLQCNEVSGNNLDDDNNQGLRDILIDRFQNALVNDSEQLFTLQKALLLPRDKYTETTGLYLNTIVTVVGTIINFNDDTYSDYCTAYFPQNKSCIHIYYSSKCFEISPASSVVALTTFLQSQTIVHILTLLDPSFYLTNAIVNKDNYYYDYGSFGNDYTIQLMIDLMIDKINYIKLDDLDQEIDNNITDALYVTLSRAKAYVRNEGIKSEDISWIKDVTNFDLMPLYSGFTPFTVAGLIFCDYIFLNLLILIFTVLYLGKVFEWIKQSQHKYLKDLYKASAIVLMFINLATFAFDIPLSIFSFYQTPSDLDYVIVKSILVLLIFILDIVVSCFNTCKYGHKCNSAMHALALCQFIWFLHRLATDAIISIIKFVIAPAQTLGTVTLLLSTVICAILFVSALLKKCQAGCNCKTCSCRRDILPAICCTFLIAICTIGLIITITLLFVALVDNGLQSAGIGGFILSLVPPTAVFVIGLCVSREKAVKIYRNVLPSQNTTISADTNEADIQIPSLDGENDVKVQTNKYTQLVQTSIAINMEGHEKFEEEPYRPAQKIGL